MRGPRFVLALAVLAGAALALVFQGCGQQPIIDVPFLCPDPQLGYEPRCPICKMDPKTHIGCCMSHVDPGGVTIEPAAGCDAGTDGGT